MKEVNVNFLQNFKKYKFTIFAEVAMLFSAVAAFVVMDLVNFYEVTWEWERIIINALPFYVLGKIICLLCKKLTVSVSVMLIIAFVYSLATYYVWMFRGQPILPWDIQAIGTAATVASTYTFFITKYIVYAFLICAGCVLATIVVKPARSKSVVAENNLSEQKKISGWKYRISEILIIILCTVYYVGGVYPELDGDLWDMRLAYYDQGMLGGFLGHIQYCFVDEPEGYSSVQLEEDLENAEMSQSDDAETNSGIEAQNIIIIMNESFADLRNINDEIITNEYMPFIDSLTENTIKGKLYVPVFGGNTCDTEFEVLVSASSVYTTPTPYQTTSFAGKESIVSYLNERGFYTSAFHPYYANNWNRDTVYENLGFDDFVSVEDMGGILVNDPRTLRWCISDKSDYEVVIDEYEKHQGEKFFMFNVTMQNHGGYEDQYDNFQNTVDLSAYGDYLKAETYLSLVKESDKQFEMLINHFSQVEEPTVICFFGDHLPALGDDFFSLLWEKDEDTLSKEERLEMYATPVVIWANYDIEEKYIEGISTNFLMLEVLKAANMELEGYYAVLNQIYEIYPVLSKKGIVDAEGNYYPASDMETDEMIMQQQYLQYYRIYE